MPSGYLDPRSKIEIIVSRPEAKEDLIHLYSLVVPTGDINKILQNKFMITELIIASQTGIYFVLVEEEAMPEVMQIDPKLAEQWMPEIKLKMLDEKYFEGKRVSQVV